MPLLSADLIQPEHVNEFAHNSGPFDKAVKHPILW